MIYLISYDLHKKKDYPKLTEAIESYPPHVHIHGSVWAVKSSKSAADIRDHLADFIDSDDSLFVIRVVKNWGSRNIPEEITNWFKEVKFD